MDKEAWRAAIHGVSKNRTWLSDWTDWTELISSSRTPDHSLLMDPRTSHQPARELTLTSFSVFSNESAIYIRWPKYSSFSFSISTSNEFSQLIPLEIECFDHLAVQKTLFFLFFISWRLINLQYCKYGFCHTLTWISHGFICVSHPNPPSHLPPHPLPLGLPSAPAQSTCLIHPTWAGDLCPKYS